MTTPDTTQAERDAAHIKRLQEQIIKLQEQVSKLLVLVSDMDRGIRTLMVQLQQMGEQPGYEITPPLEAIITAAAEATARTMEQTALKNKIVRRFSLQELIDLIEGLGLAAEDLPAGPIGARATALIQYLDRRGELGQLIEACEKARPNQDWG